MRSTIKADSADALARVAPLRDSKGNPT